jgi:hypothetical protein
MEAIILEPVDKADFEKIKEFALINKIRTSILNDEDYRFIERRKLANIADTEYPQLDITIEEIVAITKETRAQEYAKRNLSGY